jgi:primosomal protein N' (replication factor Y) (superfamily II helicase)
MSDSYTIVQVALPLVFDDCLDYKANSPVPLPGSRVLVPVGNKKYVGIVIACENKSKIPYQRLKPIEKVLDSSPLLTKDLIELGLWASRYYHYHLGSTFYQMLPSRLRQTKTFSFSLPKYYAINLNTQSKKKCSPSQKNLLKWMSDQQSIIHESTILAAGFKQTTLESLEKANLLSAKPEARSSVKKTTALNLNEQQKSAIKNITEKKDFQVFLLNGVTGSGKTETYCQAIKSMLKKGKQTLILVPEISLTPQTLAYMQKHFSVPIITLHSQLSASQKATAWMLAQSNQAKIVIGTRSAVFTPLPNLGLIVIDEEHDGSYKQETKLRYSARDLAVARAKMANVPIVLGSATPSLESYKNCQLGKYKMLPLEQRVNKHKNLTFHLIDLKKQTLFFGIAPQTLSKIKQHLDQKKQVLIFLNRKGYAPVLLCHDCAWSAVCKHCDAKMTLYKTKDKLICHHCDHRQKKPESCPDCGKRKLYALGFGTEKIEEGLVKHFPNIMVSRIDKNNAANNIKLQDILQKLDNNEPHIIVATQMMAKGHHLPNITLVVVLEADSSLYHPDFRAQEKLAQTIVQVSGRAGRQDDPGEVIIQTHRSNHPLLKDLTTKTYHEIAQTMADQRSLSKLPPFQHMAIIRAISKKEKSPEKFLLSLLHLIKKQSCLDFFGPCHLPMMKKAGYYRSQVILSSNKRETLHTVLTQCKKLIGDKCPRDVVAHINVDPLELFV